jgi:molybdenum cofactor guanylyltransferase
MTRRCGIVLAGGRGERLGAGRPKARALLAGRTLLERAVGTLRDACDEVVVVAPEGIDIGHTAARRVRDVAGHAGPLAGLVAGLEACEAADCCVLGIDFPLVTPAWPRALLERLAAAGASDATTAARAVVPRPAGESQPLVAGYGAGAAAVLRAALERGVTSLRGGLEELAVEWLDDAALSALPGGIAALLNVNTPADLAAADRALAGIAGGTR